MARTDAQRSADALVRIFEDAVANTSGGKRPQPVVNVHVDYHSFQDMLAEAELFPERNVDPFEDPTPHITQLLCRTDNGHPLDQHSVLRLLLEAKVRFVIRNQAGVPINWGRTRRLFEGPARDAVRALSPRCTHPGCRIPVTETQTDHTLEWASGGVTEPGNGNPRCGKHNRKKAEGFKVHRDQQGAWHTYRPDGTEIA